jgi:type VI secretion system protein ImpK
MSHPHTAVDSSSDVTLPASSSDQPRADTTAAVPFGERLNAVEQSRNPLLEAARVLLRALADMPDDLEVDETLLLRDLLEQEVRVFQKLCEEANIRRDHMIGARYCLCTALDEAATQTAWGREGSSGIEWISNG